MSEDTWVELQACPDHIAAEVIAGRLRAESIPAQADRVGPLPGFEQSVVRVPSRWLERARQILTEQPPTEDELTELAIRSPSEDETPR